MHEQQFNIFIALTVLSNNNNVGASNQLYSQQFYLSVCVCSQDLFVRLSCRPQQTKISVGCTTAVPSRRA